MIAAPHMIIGALIGSLIQNYPLAFLAGFVSHFIFDAVPHLEHSTFLPLEKRHDYKLTTRVIIFEFFEILLGIFIVFLFFKKFQNPAIFWAVAGAVIPDWHMVPYIGMKLRNVWGFKQFHQFHSWIHFDLKAKYWLFGLPVYIIVIGITIWFWRR